MPHIADWFSRLSRLGDPVSFEEAFAAFGEEAGQTRGGRVDQTDAERAQQLRTITESEFLGADDWPDENTQRHRFSFRVDS